MALALSGLVTERAPIAEIGVDELIALVGGGALYLQFSRSAWVKWSLGAATPFALLGVAATLAAAMILPEAGLTVGGLALFGVAFFAAAAKTPTPSWLVSGLAALFGLLDGGRGASELFFLHLSPPRLAPMLVGSDLGVMAAILAVAAVAMGAVWVARRRAALMRPFAEDAAGAGVLGLGVFWFVSHLYS